MWHNLAFDGLFWLQCKEFLGEGTIKNRKAPLQANSHERPQIQGLNKQHSSENIKDSPGNKDKEKVKSENIEIHCILKSNQQPQLMLKFHIWVTRKVAPLM